MIQQTLAMSSVVCLVNVNFDYSCHPEVWDGLLFPIDIFWVFVCTTSNSGHAAEGKTEGEISSPRFLAKAEEIPVEKANILLLSESSITQCFGQIRLMMFTLVGSQIQHKVLCLMNRMSDEQDSDVEAVGHESHILMASGTEADMGCASVTDSGDFRDSTRICWRHLVVQEKSAWSAAKLQEPLSECGAASGKTILWWDSIVGGSPLFATPAIQC